MRSLLRAAPHLAARDLMMPAPLSEAAAMSRNEVSRAPRFGHQVRVELYQQRHLIPMADTQHGAVTGSLQPRIEQKR